MATAASTSPTSAATRTRCSTGWSAASAAARSAPRSAGATGGCSRKEEGYRVARRHGLSVLVVANSPMAIPVAESITLDVVGGRFDAADDRIVERAESGDVVISNDIPLAARCLAKGAWVLSPKG